MPGYTPPSARMRQIKQQEALRKSQEAAQAEQEAQAEAEKKVEVNVGAMTATVEAGPDGELGTADDTVTIKPKAATPAKPAPAPAKPPVKKAAAKKPAAKKAAKKPRPVPKFDKDMTKEQLLKVAKRMKVKDLTMRNTKADILKALKKAARSWK